MPIPIDLVHLQFEDIEGGGDPIVIKNKGPDIAETNYWDSAQAQRGLLFLSYNAGDARVLVPDSRHDLLNEMATAKYVILSQGPWTVMAQRLAVEVLFEDNSDAPFALHMAESQFDRTLPSRNQGDGFFVTVWTRAGRQLRFPGKFRLVPEIPSLAAWEGA